MRWRRAQPGDAPAPQRSTRGRMIIAALAGAASVFSFAPFGWWPLQIACLALLFYQALRSATPKAGALPPRLLPVVPALFVPVSYTHLTLPTIYSV